MKIVKWIIVSIGALVGMFALELLVVALFPGFPTPRQNLDPLSKSTNEGDDDAESIHEVGCCF